MSSPDHEPFALVSISAGTSDPAATRLLADRIADRTGELAACHGRTVTSSVIDLREIAADISSALVSQLITPRLQAAITALTEADGIIASTPVYKAGPSGLFTSFIDILDDDLIIARPVVLAATAGTARHALVVDDQMRSMFAYLRALTIPTSLFAAPEDWGDPALNSRIDRAAVELVLLMESGFARKIRDASWESYQHEYGSAGSSEAGIALDTDLPEAGGRRVCRVTAQDVGHPALNHQDLVIRITRLVARLMGIALGSHGHIRSRTGRSPGASGADENGGGCAQCR